ncbi:MAG: hypothetical protein IPP00_12255 [Actinomycetales bacterium]|uniref:Uncharacterized protein n=1 Tax=Candidatus Phosphoribacter hodrii TaxID=2953743 RepID=A0A9D7T951_9MICO|nr:hypothetical protein [Candidatus Phosphoribacter hodrii]
MRVVAGVVVRAGVGRWTLSSATAILPGQPSRAAAPAHCGDRLGRWGRATPRSISSCLGCSRSAGDDDSWLRARGYALQQAVAGVIYYTPRRHPLADVMRRTLHAILR